MYCDRRQSRHEPLPVKMEAAGKPGGRALLVAVEVLAGRVAVGKDIVVAGALARTGAHI